MYCDLLETPCGETIHRFSPRPDCFQMYKPLGATCDTCRRPGLQWAVRPDGSRSGPLCRVRATHSRPKPPAPERPKSKARESRAPEPAPIGPTLFGEEW